MTAACILEELQHPRRCVICDGKHTEVTPLYLASGSQLSGLGIQTKTTLTYTHGGVCEKEYQKVLFPFPCPKCDETGMIATGSLKKPDQCCQGGPPCYNAPGGFADCGWCPNLRTNLSIPVMGTCTLCSGSGRLARKPEPVMVQMGWKV